MLDATLFHGIAVVIDDEIADEKSAIRAIQTQIEQGGCSVIGMPEIPDAAKLANLKSASFFVVDWYLYAAPLGDALGVGTTAIPPGLKKENARRVIEFLKSLKQVRFAPVFIFTAGPIDEVRGLLERHPDLYDPSYIFIKTKDEVRQTGVFNILADSLRQTPSAYVLKMWERQYEQAKNQLFLDFYGKSVLWPLILWKTFKEDGVPPSVELGTLIARNLLSRMTPFEFDLDSFDDAPLKALEHDKENYKKILTKVLEGERFLPGDQLHSQSIAPGDLFKDGKHYFVNIRPDCDCIARTEGQQDSIQLYLLEGSKLSSGQMHFDSEYGEIRERDTETIIFPIHNGASISFKFKHLHIKTWGEFKEKRIGRLLAPFLTRLQQRYSGYVQRPGLTRVPEAALTLPTKTTNNPEVNHRPRQNLTVSAENLPRTWVRKMLAATKSWVSRTLQRFTHRK